MQNLAVVFPNPEDGYPTKPFIDKDIQIAHPEERINWKFYAVDKAIKYVEIEFAGANFFGGDNPITKWNREVKKGQAIIYGDVPDASSLEENKYTIRGYDKDPTKKGAKVLSELDPKIVTAVP